jgi:hypothetical protein
MWSGRVREMSEECKNPNQKEIERLKKSYVETQRKINSRTLPRGITNIGDIQAFKLQDIRRLGGHFEPPRHMIG